MELIDLSRVIYDGMPKIPILPEVHVQKFLSLEKGHPLNVTELSLPCPDGTHGDAQQFFSLLTGEHRIFRGFNGGNRNRVTVRHKELNFLF